MSKCIICGYKFKSAFNYWVVVCDCGVGFNMCDVCKRNGKYEHVNGPRYVLIGDCPACIRDKKIGEILDEKV